MALDKSIECLVIGANGLVGRKLGGLLSSKGIKWKGTYSKRPENGLLKLDITDPEELEAIFLRFYPQIVFHCANLAGGVDFCEVNPKKATDFHLEATKNIGNHCKRLDATMVFISTDYVFDGTMESYNENDLPNPLNLYGKLKLESEEWIRANLKKHIVVRTTNVYGWDPETLTPNYIMNLYRTLKNNRPFNAPSFLWGNPTYVGDLVKAIFELCMNGAIGIFHVAGSSFINRLEWARETCHIFGLDYSLINEIKEPSLTMVPRPLKSRLNTAEYTNSYKTILHNAYDGLTLMRADISA